jgi:hypothetical protein
MTSCSIRCAPFSKTRLDRFSRNRIGNSDTSGFRGAQMFHNTSSTTCDHTLNRDTLIMSLAWSERLKSR